MNPKAELIRKKYLYRRLIMRRKVSLHYKSAAGLIGPDCAYHLYSQIGVAPKEGRLDQPDSTAGIERPDENQPDVS